MFKRLTALCLLAALMSTNFSRFFACAGFEVNQKYITRNLCVNKSRPWLHCNGHCYFMKKIRQAEENEKKEAAKSNLSRLETSFFQEPFRFTLPAHVLIQSNSGSFSRCSYRYSNRYIETIFKPPKQFA